MIFVGLTLLRFFFKMASSKPLLMITTFGDYFPGELVFFCELSVKSISKISMLPTGGLIVSGFCEILLDLVVLICPPVLKRSSNEYF
jgi:hypothetical protein